MNDFDSALAGPRRGGMAGVIGVAAFIAAMAGAAGTLALPGVAQAAMRGSAPAERAKSSDALAVRELLRLSTHNAFRTLSADDGFWTSTVGRIELPRLYARPQPGYRGVLTRATFSDDLQHRLNAIAAKAIATITPTVMRSITRLRVADPAMVLHTPPAGATTALRGAMGPRLINALIPVLTRALRNAHDPVIEQATASLRGSVSMSLVAHSLANATDNAIWYQIGAEEAAIRRAPQASGSATLRAALPSG